MNTVVSIIIPNYNKGELVRHSLDGLLRQTFVDWEAIVVDDCSTDKSWNLIHENASKDNRIRTIRNETNRGGNYSRNLGARLSVGKFLVFLDSDDWLAEDCLENRVREFELPENDSVDLLIFNMLSTHDGKTGHTWKYGDRKDPLVSFLRHSIPWQTMMPIWRKESFERTGGFDEAFPRLQDVELHTRALLQGAVWKFANLTTPDCYYYIEEFRITTNHAKSAEIFASACKMYVAKMKGLINASALDMRRKKQLQNALQETNMAAIRNVGVLCQRGKIDHELQSLLYREVLADADWVLKLYAACYRIGLNRLKGFNYLYRHAYRFMS